MPPIPPKAKRVFKGDIFDVYQWEQEMFDRTTEIFEMIKRSTTVVVMATMDGKILTTREEQPGRPVRELGLYGGRGEEGEEPLETAKRELLEEAGMETDDWELWKTYEPVVKMDWQIYYFIARNVRKTAELKLDAGEKIEQHEMDFEEFVEKFSSENYWAPSFVADLLRLKLEDRLEELKNKLFPA